MTPRRISLALIASSLLTVLVACNTETSLRADPRNAAQVTSGKVIYERNCASCHGADLEGQPDWKSRNPNGRVPALPHNDSGHTWHHTDDVLLGITKVAGYQSDMPAFGGALAGQQIWDVLAYIKSRWSSRTLEAQAQITKQRASAPP